MGCDVLKFKLKYDELVMLGIMCFYAALCPYNKVEESFNTQAIHDIVYKTKYIYYYDHINFPGVVPRTFVGALSVAVPAGLISYTTSCTKYLTYQVARFILALYVTWSFSTFRRSVKKLFGNETGNFLVVITCTQFHFMFYASRTLPNIFGMCCALVSTAFWLNRDWDDFLWSSGLGVLIFRFELAMLLGPMILLDVYYKKKNFKELINPGLQIAAALLISCCSIDTYLWRYTIWPELKVLYYNTWLNKSSNWGTQPLLWYFYSALPRTMLLSLPLAAVGILTERRLYNFCLPSLLFICLYSLLPHKEVRFVLYVVPMFNVASAYVLKSVWEKGQLARLVVIGGLLANLCACSVFLSASYHNYPGGDALGAVHQYAGCDQNTTVYIGNYAAQNGASRFGEQCDTIFDRRWNYIKTESLNVEQIRAFDLLLVEPKDAPHYKLTHVLVEKFYGFSRIKLSVKPPFIMVEKREVIFLLKSKSLKKKIEIRNY